MEILRKLFHAIVVGLLGFVLIIGIALAAVSLTITNSQRVKSWPLQAGIYPKITSQILNATEKPNEESRGGDGVEELQDTLKDNPLDRDRLEAAASTVYTAGYWQGKFEALADAFYGWLDGSQPGLEFEIAFNDRNEELADAFEAELSEQLKSYPTCGGGAIPNDFDPLSADCLPPGLSAEQAARQFASEIRQDDFLADAVLSSQDLDLGDGFTQNGPNVYSTLKQLPLILTSVAAVLVVLSTLSAKSRLRGLRKTGQTLFGIGLVAWLGFFIGNRLNSGFELMSEPGNTNEELLAEIAQPLMKTAFNDLTATGLWVALSVVLSGALLWLSAFTWHKVHHSDEAEALAKKAMDKKPKDDPKLPKPIEPDDQKST